MLKLISRYASLRSALKTQVRGMTAMSIKDVLAYQPVIEVNTLKNGFRIVTEDNASVLATVGIWIETGSRYENQEVNGVAHFLERLLHKGTSKRNATTLETDLESIGARMSSYTTRDRTALFIQSSSQDIEKVVEMLADVLRNSKLDEKAVEAERKCLLNELEENDNDLHGTTMDNLHVAAYQGTSMAQSPLGRTDALKSITIQNLKEWQEDNYRPVRMVMSAVGGGCIGSKLVALAEKYFGDLSNEYPRKMPEVGGVRFTGSEYRYRNDYIPHMYSAVAVEGVGYGHEGAFALEVANQFIGQWDVTHATSRSAPSRWIQKISHEHGLQYLQHFNISYKDTGLFGTYFVSKGDDLVNSQGIMRSIQHEWKHLATAASEEEVVLARNQLRTHLYQQLESNCQRADYYAKELLYTDRVRSLSDLEEAISRVDTCALRKVMCDHVYDRDTANVGVGKTEAFMSYAFTRSAMSWWRI